MKVFQIDYSRLTVWSHTDLAYINHEKSLAPFMGYPAEKAAFTQAIANRKKFPVNRGLLLQVLKAQYEKMGVELPASAAGIISENTFTVTTAHQPSLFTGPLF